MNRGPTGKEETTSSLGGETVRAFTPHPLPPSPPLDPDPPVREALDRALLALGRLDSVSTLLPDPHLFLYTYVRKEAVLSSQIEGTQSSLSDLLLFEVEEAPGVPTDDAKEVSRYVAALDRGLELLRGGLPICNRMIREVHCVLLSGGRGSERQPGEFRTSQNWIGGTRPGNARFVPPPPAAVADCMSALEKYLNDKPKRTPPLEKAACAHVQFETIHPFLDGNGRTGRLLITLILCAEGVLRDPLLYLSLHLKQHRDEYYEMLNVVRREGDWERWLRFVAEAVEATAQGAVKTAQSMCKLFEKDRATLQGTGRLAGSALRVHHELQRRPVATVGSLRSSTGLTAPTISKVLEALSKKGMIREVTGRRRNRVFTYHRYLAMLNEGT